MIGLAGFWPWRASYRSCTLWLPQPKYFCPSSTWTLPARTRFGAGGFVSNDTNVVFAGLTGVSAFAVNTGQPPTEIQAPRSGYRFVPLAIIAAHRTLSSWMSYVSMIEIGRASCRE